MTVTPHISAETRPETAAPVAADNLRRVHRAIRREWQAAEEAFERWCSDRRREIDDRRKQETQ